MNDTSTDRTALMLLRVWIEGNARDGFRARIIHTLDSTGPERATEMAASPDALCTVVQRWVDEFVSSTRMQVK